MTPATALPVELQVLAWSVMLLFGHIVLQSGLATLETGLPYNAGPRDDDRLPRGVYARRAQRALANFLETYPAFIALAVALAISGRAGGTGAQGALFWIGARVVYVPLYLAGVPYVRTLAFGVSIWGLIRMFEQLLWP
jgi:uncharacterized MAPEG superfamily protein